MKKYIKFSIMKYKGAIQWEQIRQKKFETCGYFILLI